MPAHLPAHEHPAQPAAAANSQDFEDSLRGIGMLAKKMMSDALPLK